MTLKRVNKLWVATVDYNGKPVEFVSRVSMVDALSRAMRGGKK